MKTYTVDCTGDACVGDQVKFERAVFTGSFKKPKFSHNETIEGEIIRDSYGDKKQQHTFTLRLSDESIILIKGRNLYRNGCLRAEWKDEKERAKILSEKHNRGSAARSARKSRKEIEE
jgi:hypothetical protein